MHKLDEIATRHDTGHSGQHRGRVVEHLHGVDRRQVVALIAERPVREAHQGAGQSDAARW